MIEKRIPARELSIGCRVDGMTITGVLVLGSRVAVDVKDYLGERLEVWPAGRVCLATLPIDKRK